MSSWGNTSHAPPVAGERVTGKHSSRHPGHSPRSVGQSAQTPPETGTISTAGPSHLNSGIIFAAHLRPRGCEPEHVALVRTLICQREGSVQVRGMRTSGTASGASPKMTREETEGPPTAVLCERGPSHVQGRGGGGGCVCVCCTLLASEGASLWARPPVPGRGSIGNGTDFHRELQGSAGPGQALCWAGPILFRMHTSKSTENRAPVIQTVPVCVTSVCACGQEI